VGLRDKKGRPVQDLKSSDLSITDSGRTVLGGELKVSNDTAGRAHVITFLFGRLDDAGNKNAAHAARNILKELGDNSAVVGVWAIDKRLHVLQSFTSDRALVDTAVSNATVNRDTALASASAAQEKLLTAAVNTPEASDNRSSSQKKWDLSSFEALNDSIQITQERHAPGVIVSLMAAAQSQRSLPGRKAVIYFTQEVPTDLDSADMLKATSRKLRDASASVYVIDMNALDEGAAEGMQAALVMGGMAASNHLNPAPALTGPASGIQSLVTPAETKQITDTINELEIEGTTSNKNMLALLADSTGGGYTDIGSSMKKISHQIETDLSNYYTITYPEPDRLDGNFHAVTVKLMRPGLKVATHPGYFAIPAETNTATTLREPGVAGPSNESFGELARLADDATSADLAFRSAVLRFGESASGIHSVVAVEVPIEQLEVRKDPNTDLFSLHATVAAEIRNASGTPVARFQEEFRRHGAIAFADAARSQSLSMERAASLPPGDYTLDAVVRDWNAQKIGKTTQTIHLEKTGDEAVLSDVVLVGATENADGAGVLKYGGERVVPNLSGAVSDKNGIVRLYFQLYPQDVAKAAKGTEDLRLEVSKNGKLLATLPIKSEALQANEVSARVATVKLSSAGSYDLAVVLHRGGQITERHLQVTSDDVEESASDKSSANATVSAAFMPASLDLDTKPSTSKPLSLADSEALLSGAREHALSYTHMLPNFLCVESIERASDHKGTGVWKRHDSIVEMLRYSDKVETRTILEVNGQKSRMQADHIEGAHSNGEFGSILQAIFDPAVNGVFTWQKAEEQNGEMLQVFSYKVPSKDSQFLLTDSTGTQVKAALHGYVFVDADTRSVRRLIAQTEDLPPTFGIKASWMAIDYDYIGINGHDYLLPTRGEVGLKQGRHEAVLNQLRFSNYRRFGSHVRMLGNGPITANGPQ
jgi:VWFA-related protein